MVIARDQAASVPAFNQSIKFVPGLSAVHRTPLSWRRLAQRVCRAWHRTREVKVLLPGVRRAEG